MVAATTEPTTTPHISFSLAQELVRLPFYLPKRDEVALFGGKECRVEGLVFASLPNGGRELPLSYLPGCLFYQLEWPDGGSQMTWLSGLTFLGRDGTYAADFFATCRENVHPLVGQRTLKARDGETVALGSQIIANLEGLSGVVNRAFGVTQRELASVHSFPIRRMPVYDFGEVYAAAGR